MNLQNHYNLINEGKGNKVQFVKQARELFPQYFNQYTTYDNAISTLKSKQIISEAGAGGVVSKGFDIWDWKKILGEEVKATEKTTSKEVIDRQAHAFQPSDMKNVDNINFNEIMKGFYCEMKVPENADKTGDELKAIVVKNLAKDPLYYTKNGMFGEQGVGYTDEAPGLGKNTQPKSKNASILGGRDEVNSESEIVKNSLVGSTKKNVQDSLGDKEAKDSMPKKVKEMEVTPQNSKGVKKMPMPGKEKKIKLKESQDPNNFELDQENSEDAPMGVNDKAPSKPMKEPISIKSTLEKISQAVFNEKDLNKAKQIFKSHIENSRINDKDKNTILKNIEATKTKPKLDYYLVNSLLHYEGSGLSKLKETDTTGAAGNPKKEKAAKQAQKGIKPNPNVKEQKLRSLIREIINEELEEVRANTNRFGQHSGGDKKGKIFIPFITTLSRDAVESINKKGEKRAGWDKAHIKVIKKDNEIKLLVSQLLIDAIVGTQRGRTVYKPGASIKGTGITSEETQELSGEFKKLIKVLSSSGKLVKNGDYYLLDIPTKYNPDMNQYEMPLPNEVTESVLRSLVYNIINEELEKGMSLEDAKAEAQRISEEEGVTQHVEETSSGSGKYRVSDWYDSDLTVASYENGINLNGELNEYGEDSGGQDMTWGMYNEKPKSGKGTNQDFIDKGEYDYHNGVSRDNCPYSPGFNKYYGANLEKLWLQGWLKAAAETDPEFTPDNEDNEIDVHFDDQSHDYDDANLSENDSSIKKGDILHHKNSDATLKVTDVDGTTIKMEVTKISDKTPSYIKVGQPSKTNLANIGKTYTKK